MALASSKAFSSIFNTLSPINQSKFVLACSGSNHVDVIDRRRRIMIFGSSLALTSSLLGSNQQRLPMESAIALEQFKEKEEELEEEEERNVNLFQVLLFAKLFVFSGNKKKESNFFVFCRKLRRLLFTLKLLSFPKRLLVIYSLMRKMERSKGQVQASFGISLVTL